MWVKYRWKIFFFISLLQTRNLWHLLRWVRNFAWFGDINSKKLVTAKWKVVCQPIKWKFCLESINILLICWPFLKMNRGFFIWEWKISCWTFGGTYLPLSLIAFRAFWKQMLKKQSLLIHQTDFPVWRPGKNGILFFQRGV